MTGSGGAPAVPPDSPQGRTRGPRHDTPDPGLHGRVGDPPARPADDLGPDVLAPREEALIEGAVASIGRSGRGPVIATALVAAAFLLGLFRPWDLLGAPATIPPGPRPASSGASADQVAAVASGAPAPTAPSAPRSAITCAFPSQWLSSTIEDWTGRPARVWKVVEVVQASGPDDPSIQFAPIASPVITAIGWCAPVDGPDRPPQNLVATLYQVRDGIARAIPFDRLEPAQPDALGELWVPPAQNVGNRPPWPVGRYVIELRSPSGRYVRYLGLELTDRIVRPSADPESSASAAP